MKKLMIFFIGVGMTLVSCKTHLDSLAANSNDDVYYNPAKEHKLNTPPQPVQYDNQNQYGGQQAYNPNQGKIGATAADNNNPYYKDPKFNYDDYYDNAYAARINRFQTPIYGTGYYDPYYTNQYTYTQNPSQYGTSIYSSYNMGPSYGSSMYGTGMGYGSGYGGYYSPSQTFNNAYYNPYYNGYGSSMGMGYGSGYGMGYGSGMMIGYGMGYGSGMGMGCGGYNPYGMGMGYGGYNPYGMGMGYGGYNPYGMGYGYSSPMYSSTGYYNSYDYNSSTYHYGPRGTTHTGGNSTVNAPMPTGPHREIASNNSPLTTINNGAVPFSQERFSQVAIPKENYIKMVEAKNPPAMNNQFIPTGAEANPRYNPYANSPGNNGGGYNNGGNYLNSNNATPVRPIQGNAATPRGNGYGVTEGSVPNEPKPHKWFSGSNWGGDNGAVNGAGYNGNINNGGFNNNNNNSNSTPSYSSPGRGSGSWGGGGSSGGGGGRSGGGGGGRR